MDSSLNLKSHDNIFLSRSILWGNRGADEQILAALFRLIPSQIDQFRHPSVAFPVPVGLRCPNQSPAWATGISSTQCPTPNCRRTAPTCVGGVWRFVFRPLTVDKTAQFNCWAVPSKRTLLDFRADKDLPGPPIFGAAGYFPSCHRPLPGNGQAQSSLTGWSMSTLPPGFIQTRSLAQKPRTRTLSP